MSPPDATGGLDFLAAGAARDPGAPALHDGRDGWSYGELDALVDGAAARIAAAARGGGAVALLLPPSVAAVVAVHAAGRAGRPVAPLNPGLTPPEVARAVETLGPSLLVHDGSTAELARSAAGPRGTPLLPGEALLAPGDPDGSARTGEGGPSPARSAGPRPPEAPEPFAVLWTSGTSGRSRGVALGARALAAHADATRRRLSLSPDDAWLSTLSPAHVGGLALVLRAARLGSRLVVRPRFDADELLQLAHAGEVTHASLVPVMLRRVLDRLDGRPGPRGLRTLLVGGAHAPPALVDAAVRAGLPVALTYGLTEAGSQVATAPPGEVREDPTTVGRPLDGVEVALGEDGEILVRGPTLAAGYVGDARSLVDGEGWLHTGDRGSLDARGRLSVAGRRSDRITTGGVSVDPAEVEAALRLHDGVDDAAVVGLPDPEWGERVAAAVVAVAGARPSEAELGAFARERLAAPKVPRALRLVEALPRNPNGKVDRAAVRSLFGPEGRER